MPTMVENGGVCVTGVRVRAMVECSVLMVESVNGRIFSVNGSMLGVSGSKSFMTLKSDDDQA